LGNSQNSPSPTHRWETVRNLRETFASECKAADVPSLLFRLTVARNLRCAGIAEGIIVKSGHLRSRPKSH
jgi:hypothetical protein